MKCTLTVLNQWLSEPDPKVQHSWKRLLESLSEASVEDSDLEVIEAATFSKQLAGAYPGF